MKIIKKLIKLIKDIIAPKKCYSCNEEWHFLCYECYYKLDNFKPFCYTCKNLVYNFEIHNDCKEEVYYDKIIVLTHYRNKIIKKLIKDWKYYYKKDIFEDFWQYLWELFLDNENIKNNSDYIIISTPMYFLKRFKRGYNQADILAKYFSINTLITYKKNIIKKIKNTNQQSKINKKNRESNLKNTFKINKKEINKIRNKTIIIIDDVISTGSTINEISKLLKNSWITRVIWVIIASD